MQNIQKRSYHSTKKDNVISSIECDSEINKFITLDIETQGNNNNHLQEVTYVSAYKGYGIGKVFTVGGA